MTRERFGLHRSKDSTENRTLKNGLTAVAVGGVTTAVGVVGYKYGIAPDFLDSQIVPQPPTNPELVDGMVAVNEGLRSAAPVAALGALGLAAYYSISGRLSGKNRARNKMARTEYSGIDDIQQTTDSKTIIGKTRERGRKFQKGTGIAALAIVLSSATSGVEHEVSNGPLRPIDSVTKLAGIDGEYTLILQDSNNTFMDDSFISPQTMDELVDEGQERGIQVIPFNKTLMNINGKSALQVSVPDTLFEDISGVEVFEGCTSLPVIVDDTVGAKVGEGIDINGSSAQVISIENDMAQMNRSIAIVSDTDMKECLQDGANESYFGAFVPGDTLDEVKEILEDTDMDQAATEFELFLENNRDFWRANGTPVLLQLIAYIAIFGGMASAGERKNTLQRNVKEIGIMRAAGVPKKEIRAIEDRRALSETLRATLIAAPAAPLVTAAFNAAELGMKVGVGPREMAVGSMVTLGAKLIAGRRAVNGFEKNLELSQAVKG